MHWLISFKRNSYAVSKTIIKGIFTIPVLPYSKISTSLKSVIKATEEINISKKLLLKQTIQNFETLLRSPSNCNKDELILELNILHDIGIIIPLDYFYKVSFICCKSNDYNRIEKIINLSYYNLNKIILKESKSVRTRNPFDQLIIAIESFVVRFGDAIKSFEFWNKLKLNNYINRRDTLESSIKFLKGRNIKSYDIILRTHHDIKENLWNQNSNHYSSLMRAIETYILNNSYISRKRFFDCIKLFYSIMEEITQINKLMDSYLDMTNSFITNDLRMAAISLYIVQSERLKFIEFNSHNFSNIILQLKNSVRTFIYELISNPSDISLINISNIFFNQYKEYHNNIRKLKYRLNTTVIDDISTDSIAKYLSHITCYESLDESLSVLRDIISTCNKNYLVNDRNDEFYNLKHNQILSFYHRICNSIMSSYCGSLLHQRNHLNKFNYLWYNITTNSTKIFNLLDKIQLLLDHVPTEVFNVDKSINIKDADTNSNEINLNFNDKFINYILIEKKIMHILCNDYTVSQTENNRTIYELFQSALNNLNLLPIHQFEEFILNHLVICILCYTNNNYLINKCYDLIFNDGSTKILAETSFMLTCHNVYFSNEKDFKLNLTKFESLLINSKFNSLSKSSVDNLMKSNFYDNICPNYLKSLFFSYCRLSKGFKLIKLYQLICSNNIERDKTMYIWMILSLCNLEPSNSVDSGLCSNPNAMVFWLIECIENDSIKIDSAILHSLLKLYTKLFINDTSIISDDNFILIVDQMFQLIDYVSNKYAFAIDSKVFEEILKVCLVSNRYDQIDNISQRIQSKYNISFHSYCDILLRYNAFVSKDISLFESNLNKYYSNFKAINTSVIDAYIILLYNNNKINNIHSNEVAFNKLIELYVKHHRVTSLNLLLLIVEDALISNNFNQIMKLFNIMNDCYDVIDVFCQVVKHKKLLNLLVKLDSSSFSCNKLLNMVQLYDMSNPSNLSDIESVFFRIKNDLTLSFNDSDFITDLLYIENTYGLDKLINICFKSDEKYEIFSDQDIKNFINKLIS